MNTLLALCFIFGWLILYGLSSLLIAALIFQRKPEKLGLVTTVTYSTVCALMLSSLLLWVSHLAIPNLIVSYWVAVAVVLGSAIALRRTVDAFIVDARSSIDKQTLRGWLIDIGLAAVFVISFALLERYLPEYDGYVHERMADILLQNGTVTIFSATYRPGFLYLFTGTKLIWPEATLFFTKFLFPVLVTFLTIQTFRLWLKPETSRWLAWLVPFSAPLFVSQAIYFRAQSLVALFFPLAAYTFFVRPERSLKFLILLLGVVGVLFFHIFFVFVLLLAVPFLYTELRRVPTWNIREKALFVGALVAAAAALSSHLIQIISTISIYINFSHLSFRLNSLVSLNTEANGLTELLKYYTHQIFFLAGIVLVILIITQMAGKQPEPVRRTERLLWMMIMALFIGAEILPRFGFQYDPQRIWLFINLLLICLLLWKVSHLPPLWQKRATILFGLATLLSLVVVGYFVNTRMKTFNQDDRDAVSFINQSAPDALIIGPNVKYPGIAIYKADQVLFYISFPHLISYSDPAALDAQIKWLSYTNPESRRQKVAAIQKAGAEIDAKMRAEESVPAELLTNYEQELVSHSATAQPVFIYICNNISYCADPGFSYAAQQQQLAGYPFLAKVFENSTVTLYRYLPTPGDPTPPENYVYMEKVSLGSADLTEYGAR